MTLITKLSSSFTDTTLPILQKDPALPSAGGVVMYDMKSVGTWPSQASTITTSSQIFSLASNPWRAASPSTSLAYDSNTGRVTPSGAYNLDIEDSTNRVFADPTHNYCVSFWFFVPSTHAAFAAYIHKGTGNTNVNTHGFLIRAENADSRIVQVWRPASTDGNATQNGLITSALSVGVHRIGYAWSRNSGVWQRKTVIDNGTVSGWTNDTFGSGVNGVQNNSAWPLRFGGSAGAGNAANLGFYRFYIENLTLSGRTPEQVWAADWARGNGRFS